MAVQHGRPDGLEGQEELLALVVHRTEGTWHGVEEEGMAHAEVLDWEGRRAENLRWESRRSRGAWWGIESGSNNGSRGRRWDWSANCRGPHRRWSSAPGSERRNVAARGGRIGVDAMEEDVVVDLRLGMGGSVRKERLGVGRR